MLTAREIAWSKKDNEKPLFINAINKGADSTTISYRYLGLDNSYILFRLLMMLP